MKLFQTPLGEMEVTETYLYYDRPFIFLCKDKVGTKYLVHLLDEDDEGERWFLVPSSDSRVEYVRAGKITLRESILQAEPDWVWDIKTHYDGTEGVFCKKYCKDIIEIDLPSQEAKLSFPERNLPKLSPNVAIQARQKVRDIVLISLNKGDHSQTIPVSDYGSILLRTQNLITSLALECGGSCRGRIPESVIQNTTMNYTGNFAASVGIILESQGGKLFEPCIDQSMERLIALIQAGATAEELKPLLLQLPLKATARYRFFLQSLYQAGLSFNVEWSSPCKDRKTAFVSKDQVKDIMGIINLEGEDLSQTIELKGNLIGLLVDKKKRRSSFEFVSLNGERYKGTLEQSLIDIFDAKHIELPAYNVSAEMEETIEINPSTGEERVSYILLKVI